ncbi:MAG: NPCBM/NEW2 domain-containing protein [Pirellulales bacterium]
MAFLCFATEVTAAPLEVVPVDGEAFAGELVSVAADRRVTFRVVEQNGPPAEAGSPTRTLPLEELVRWGHPVAARPQTIVVLADGGRLVTAADWAGGAAVRLDGDAMVVLSDTFGEVRLPRAAVRGVVFVHQRHPEERAALAGRVQSFSGKKHAIFLTNDDRLVGSVEELARGSVTIETEAGSAKLPLSRVEAVLLSDSRQPSAVSHQPEVVMGMRDGSVVYAVAVRGDEKELVVELADGVKLLGGGMEDVVLLQSLGGRFVYLSDLEPADYRHVPYLNAEWPYQRDRNLLGEPLVVRSKRYLKGISMHSAGRLTYRLDDAYQRFDAAVAVDDSAGGRGSVTFGVYVLRDGQWQEAFTSGVVRGGEGPRQVSVDVSGAQGLTLTVDYADRGDEMDRADWLDARLVKSRM